MNTQLIQENFEDYKLKTQQKLTELNQEAQVLQKKALEASAEKQKQYQKMLDDLEVKRSQMQTQLTLLEQKGESAYAEMKTGLEKAWTELSSAFDKAKSTF